MGNSNIRSFAKYLKKTFVILIGDVKPGFAVPMTKTDLLTSVKSFNRSHLPIFSDNKNRGFQGEVESSVYLASNCCCTS